MKRHLRDVWHLGNDGQIVDDEGDRVLLVSRQILSVTEDAETSDVSGGVSVVLVHQTSAGSVQPEIDSTLTCFSAIFKMTFDLGLVWTNPSIFVLWIYEMNSSSFDIILIKRSWRHCKKRIEPFIGLKTAFLVIWGFQVIEKKVLNLISIFVDLLPGHWVHCPLVWFDGLSLGNDGLDSDRKNISKIKLFVSFLSPINVSSNWLIVMNAFSVQ